MLFPPLPGIGIASGGAPIGFGDSSSGDIESRFDFNTSPMTGGGDSQKYVILGVVLVVGIFALTRKR